MKENKDLSPDEIIANFTKAKIEPKTEPIEQAEKTPTQPSNLVTLDNKRKLEIKSVKIKYFITGDFTIYKLLQDLGVSEVIRYTDGIILLSKFLSAVFNKPYKTEQIKISDEEYKDSITFDEFVTQLVEEELTIIDIENIIETTLRVNNIKTENFQTPLMMD